MPAVPNAIPQQPTPGPEFALHLLIEPEPWFRVFLRNLGDLFRPEPPQVWLSAKPATYWADALVNRPAPWTAIGNSFLCHALGIFAVYGLTLLWLHQPHTLPQELPAARPIDQYELSEYLPAVHSTPEHQRHKPPVRRQAQQADPEYARQEIVSIQEQHNSIRQTIVNPVTPRLLNQDVPLPNIVAWTPIPSAAPVAPRHSFDQLPVNAPAVVPPTPETAKRNLNALQFPVQPQTAVAPTAAPVTRNLAELNLPQQPGSAVPPSPNAVQRNLGDINLGLNVPTVEAPKLPVPAQQATSGAGPGATTPAVAPAPPVTAGTGKAEGQVMGQLLALNVQPVAPSGPLTVPEGNRRGEFAVGPDGRPGASGRPEIAAGEKNSPAGGPDGTSSLPANIYVAEPPKRPSSSVVVASALPPPAPKPDLRNAVPPREPDAHGSERIENQVFGDRRYYTMALNMPNFTSAGGSWIMRFAELDPIPGSADEGLSAPIALNKVDPAYPAALIRERVEGLVILRAVIHTDGTVGDVQVLQSLNDSLDENARTALEKWHFRPGTRNGSPVNVEAVIKIPFRAPRAMF